MALVGGCAPPEQPLLARFFEASRLRDKTQLEKFSTVIFEPRQDGIVRRFSVASVGPERAAAGRVTKDVVVGATVDLGGKVIEEPLVVTLERHDERPDERWVVVAVTAAVGGRSAPPL